MTTKLYKATDLEEVRIFKMSGVSSYFKPVLLRYSYRLLFLSFLFLMNGFLKAQDVSKPNLAGANKINSALVKKDSAGITFYTLPGEPNIRMFMPKGSGNPQSNNNSSIDQNQKGAALNSVLSAPTCISAPLYPANGQTGVCPNYTISWPSVSGATGYKVFLGGENGTNPPFWQIHTGNSMTFFGPDNYFIYWRIVPVNADGDATGCPLWSFTTGVFTRSSVQLDVSTGTAVCAGTLVTFTAIPTNGGSNPQYRWWQGYTNDIRFPQRKYINGETGPTLTLSNIANGDKIGVEIGYNASICTLGSFSEVTMTINPSSIWYKDADNDNYSDGTNLTQCDRPTGYKLSTELTATSGDCNDDPAAGGTAINPGATEVCDGLDNNCNGSIDEGFTDTDGDTIADCVDPDDDNDGTLDGDDCAPLDATIWRNGNFYLDGDGDGYGTGTVVSLCYGTNTPAGYSTFGGDCKDDDPLINPGATEICDGIDNNCDGSIDEGFTNTDGDNMADCVDPDDDNDGILDADDCAPLAVTQWRNGTFYVDGDGDGYGTGTSVTLCYGATTPTGYSTVTGDCNDGNAAINPGAIEVCDGIDNNCNGQVDENCGPCKNATGLSTTNITAISATLNWVANVNPVQWQVQYKTTNLGSKWVDVILTGDKRFAIITGLSRNQSYIWHIRAKCGKTWTAYSMSMSFKTLTSAPSSRQAPATMDEGKTIQLYPNPSRGQFRLLVRLPESINANAKIELFSTSGQAVYTSSGFVANGVLQTNIQLPITVASGTYVVKVSTANEVQQIKLIYSKE